MVDNTRKTILTIVFGFIILFLFFENDWMIYTGLAIGILSFLSPFISKQVVKIWHGIAKILGFINTWILLTLIYYFVLLPLSWISKLSNKSIILRDKGLTSYFTERNHKYAKEDFEKPW